MGLREERGPELGQRNKAGSNLAPRFRPANLAFFSLKYILGLSEPGLNRQLTGEHEAPAQKGT